MKKHEYTSPQISIISLSPLAPLWTSGDGFDTTKPTEGEDADGGRAKEHAGYNVWEEEEEAPSNLPL